MPTYNVTLVRHVTQSYQLQVVAQSERQARAIALSQSGNIDFNDGSSSEPDYEVESCETAAFSVHRH